MPEALSQLSQVTVSIFTKNINSPNAIKCLDRLPQNVNVLVFSGHMIHSKSQNGSWQVQDRAELRSRPFNFSRNCNITAEIATTRWILILNDDCFLEHNAVQEMLNIADHDQSDITSGIFTYPNGFREKYLYVQKLKAGPRGVFTTGIYPKPFVSGAMMFVKTNLLRKIRFDETLDFGGEDFDFCLRAVKSGAKISFSDNAQAFHVIRGSSGSIRGGYKRTRSNLKFYKKYPELFEGSFFWLAAHLLLRDLTLGVRLRLHSSYGAVLSRLNQTEMKRQSSILLVLWDFLVFAEKE